MSVILPSLYAVIPMVSQIVPYAQALFDQDRDLGTIDVKELAKLVQATEKLHLARLDDPAKPVIKKDATGNDTLIMAWGHPKNPLDTDYVVALLCKKDGNKFVPETVLRGAKANVLIVGGMSCCGSALQAHWTQTKPQPEANIDEARIPLAGLPHPEHAHWLKGKVQLADTVNNPTAKAAIEQVLMDVLSVRFPNDARFKPVAAANTRYLSPATFSRAMAPS